MKQFILIAYDATDAGAQERRMAARQAHTDYIGKLRSEGKVLCGVAITDDSGKMIGSVVIFNLPTRADVDSILSVEPYVVGKVWNDIKVLNGQLGLSFSDLLKKAA